MQSEDLHNRDLKFFGAVSASISHELKNVLAIINEMMGLLDDLSRMAEKGRPLEPERLQSVAAKMKQQIDRGDGIIRGMNQFAHSVDHREDSIDLNDLVAFVGRLAQRRLAQREVALETRAGEAPATLSMNRFALEHLLWAALARAMQWALPGTRIVVEVPAGSASVVLRAQTDPSAGEQAGAAAEDLAALAGRLGATVKENAKAGEVRIDFK